MNNLPSVLVVAATPELVARLEGMLGSDGWRPTFVRTFAEARRHLDGRCHPDLLISEIKLGEYNGLHLALRSLAAGIPAIVIGEAAFGREAEQLGAIWLSPQDASGERLPAAMARVVELSHTAGGAFAGFSPALPTEQIH